MLELLAVLAREVWRHQVLVEGGTLSVSEGIDRQVFARRSFVFVMGSLNGQGGLYHTHVFFVDIRCGFGPQLEGRELGGGARGETIGGDGFFDFFFFLQVAGDDKEGIIQVVMGRAKPGELLAGEVFDGVFKTQDGMGIAPGKTIVLNHLEIVVARIILGTPIFLEDHTSFGG